MAFMMAFSAAAVVAPGKSFRFEIPPSSSSSHPSLSLSTSLSLSLSLSLFGCLTVKHALSFYGRATLSNSMPCEVSYKHRVPLTSQNISIDVCTHTVIQTVPQASDWSSGPWFGALRVDWLVRAMSTVSS